ncbi:MAG: glycosyltransferase family 39 protein [Candidatus Omnitrophica bacterium]|nr:glycosyltransferase family 39 protein [Candidatus Omnitrophota bacterium]
MNRLPKYGLFIIPLIINIFFISGYEPEVVSGSDPVEYQIIASNILQRLDFFDGRSYAFRPPLYPFFISVVFAVMGKFTFNIFIAQAITAALSAVLIYQAAKLLSGKLAAITAWYLMILNPYTLLFCKQVLRTNLIIFWLSAFLCLILYARINKYKKLYQSLFFGFTCGLGALLAPSVMPWIIAYWVIVIFDKGFKLGDRIKWALLSMVVFSVVVSPWFLRNYQLFKTPVFVSSCGFNFYVGNNPYSNGTFHMPHIEDFSDQERKDEVSMDRAILKKSLDYCKRNPLATIQRIPAKIYYFFESPANPLLNLFDIILTIAFLFSLYIAKDYPDSRYKFLLWPFLLRFVVVMVFFSTWRYRVEVYPFIYIFISMVLAKHLIKKYNIQIYKDDLRV